MMYVYLHTQIFVQKKYLKEIITHGYPQLVGLWAIFFLCIFQTFYSEQEENIISEKLFERKEPNLF